MLVDTEGAAEPELEDWREGDRIRRISAILMTLSSAIQGSGIERRKGRKTGRRNYDKRRQFECKAAETVAETGPIGLEMPKTRANCKWERRWWWCGYCEGECWNGMHWILSGMDGDRDRCRRYRRTLVGLQTSIITITSKKSYSRNLAEEGRKGETKSWIEISLC